MSKTHFFVRLTYIVLYIWLQIQSYKFKDHCAVKWKSPASSSVLKSNANIGMLKYSQLQHADVSRPNIKYYYLLSSDVWNFEFGIFSSALLFFFSIL